MKYLIFFCTLCLFSCSKNDSNENTGNTDSTGINNNNNTNKIPAAFAGVWKGTYTGVGGGTWDITVKGDGAVTGSVITNVPTRIKEGYATGTVSETGQIKFQQVAPVSGPVFVGTLTGTKASGTFQYGFGAIGWEPWEGTKQ